MKKVLLLLVLLLIIATLMAGCINCKCASKVTRDDVKSFSVLDVNLVTTSCSDSCKQMLSVTKGNNNGTSMYSFPQKVYIYMDVDNASDAWGFEHQDNIIVHIPEEMAKTKGLI